MARLILAAGRVGATLTLGHDQSYASGIVCGHLAAKIVDRLVKSRSFAGDDDAFQVIVRMLRAGLFQQAISTMRDCSVVTFGSRAAQDNDDALGLVVCDDPRRIAATNEATRNERIRAGLMEEPETLSSATGEVKFSLGEWVVTTAMRGLPPALEAHQLAQIVAIDPLNNWIDVLRHGKFYRLDLARGPAIRPAAAIYIRDAWDAPPDADLAIEATDPRRIWSTLILAASRNGRARLFVEPSIAKTAEELVEAARRSIPGGSAYLGAAGADADADTELNRIRFEIDDFPEYVRAQAAPAPALTDFHEQIREMDESPEYAPPRAAPEPALTGFHEQIRRRISQDPRRVEAYDRLYRYVAADNPDRRHNLDRALGFCQSEVTKAVIRFLAAVPPPEQVGDELDVPAALLEVEPEQWSAIELSWFEQDLDTLTMARVGPLWQPVARRRLHGYPDNERDLGL